MPQLSDFDAIRPYTDSEIRGAIRELLDDKQFQAVVHRLVPWVPTSVAMALLRLLLTGVNTVEGFQGRVMRPTCKAILKHHSDGYSYTPNPTNTPDRCYTFISNHRDIVLDISIFNLLLYDGPFHTTCEIAIGDNLLIYPWIERLVRMNKSFIVRRSLPPRELLASSQLMSQYMHYAINELHENLWIAQREGRAKDSSDNTQEGVIKMLTIGDNLSPIDSLRQLNIVPLTVSYEFDPCDFLKAKEFQLKRDNPNYKKTRQDDLTNMSTGIFGYKGRIVYRTANCINEWLDSLSSLSHNDFFRAVALRMDQQIHSNYELYPNNYIALDRLNHTDDYASHYTGEDICRFDDYLARQIDKIDLPNKDIDYLNERILTMYANPLKNYIKSL